MFSGFMRFWEDRSGNFAVMTSLLSVPLLLSVGLSVDYARYSAAHRHLQELADIAALRLAGTEEEDEATLRKLAMNVVEANTDRDRLQNVTIADLDADADQVDIELDGDIPVTFMGIAGFDRLETSAYALAERAAVGGIEVALILDNTWSMSATDAHGVPKIDALKTAAGNLVDQLLVDDDGSVKVGLVPYADYVNVGVENRGASWLSIPEEYSVDPGPRICVPVTKEVCVKSEKQTYTKVVDGVEEPATRWVCVAHEIQNTQWCSGGGPVENYTWHGCVGSRVDDMARLNDKFPSVPYPGFLDQVQRCPKPIERLSSDKEALEAAITGMTTHFDYEARFGDYKPLTYIPAGLTWGLNLLSPQEPFGEAAAYDAGNMRPRKVAVLMTDGENTLHYREEAADRVKGKGDHYHFFGAKDAQERQFGRANDDTMAICDYMKEQNIEIYTIAFMLEADAGHADAAKDILEDCASGADHFFDASDSAKLIAAFGNIGASLRMVRLAR